MTILFSLILFFTNCKGLKEISERLLGNSKQNRNSNSDVLKSDTVILYTGWYYVLPSSIGCKRQLDKSDETYYLSIEPIVTAKNIAKMEIYERSYNDKEYFGLFMQLDEEGTKNWSLATRKAEVNGSKLAFILNNRLMQVAQVNSQITSGATALNRGNYSKQELESFKRIIESEKQSNTPRD